MTELPDTDEEEQTPVMIRRAPRFSSFMVFGALLGLIATLILVSLYPTDPEVGFGATFGFFVLFGVPLGIGIGAIVAIILDRRATRRAIRVVAGKLEVNVKDEQAQETDLSMELSTDQRVVTGRKADSEG